MRYLPYSAVGVALFTLLIPIEATGQERGVPENGPRLTRRLILPAPDASALTRAQAMPRAAERGVGRKVFGAIVGAVGGFFAGGYLGAAIEGDRCHCDDPGLKGAVIGAPIGGVAGGILGWRYLF